MATVLGSGVAEDIDNDGNVTHYYASLPYYIRERVRHKGGKVVYDTLHKCWKVTYFGS